MMVSTKGLISDLEGVDEVQLCEEPFAHLALCREARDRLRELDAALANLVARFDKRDWVLSGDDSKALHHARNLVDQEKGR